METDISACQSQQSSTVIWTITRESQRAREIEEKKFNPSQFSPER